MNRAFDRVRSEPAPDLWPEIERRLQRIPPGGPPRRGGILRAVPVAVVVAVIVGVMTWAVSWLWLRSNPPAIPVSPQRTPSQSQVPAAPDSVWAVLGRQPLHFPSVAGGAACPITPPFGLPPNHRFSRSTWRDWTGGNPVFELGLGSVHYTTSVGGPTEGWYPWKVLWFATPGYEGPILIRGRQLDGPNEIRFNGRISTDPARTEIHHTVRGQNRVWATNLFFRGPGCYAVQMDGLGFSKVVVFQAEP